MSNNEILRVGTVPYTNAFPLVWYLNEFLPSAVITSAIPSQLAPQLARGEIDVAMLSSYALCHNPNFGFVPGVGICSDGAVRSVCIFAKKEIRDCQTIALDLSSVTSTVLIRVLLKHYWNLEPTLVHYSPPVENGLHHADAALSIGDPSLVDLGPEYIFYDLGEIWKQWTGYPFIYALWITREGIDPEALQPAFYAAKEKAFQNLATVAESTAKIAPHSADFYQYYFTNNIKYDITKSALTGMELFFEYAKGLD